MQPSPLSNSRISHSLVAKSCLTPGDPRSPARFLCPWNSLGRNTGVGCHFLLQGLFLTQGSVGRDHYYKFNGCTLKQSSKDWWQNLPIGFSSLFRKNMPGCGSSILESSFWSLLESGSLNTSTWPSMKKVKSHNVLDFREPQLNAEGQ